MTVENRKWYQPSPSEKVLWDSHPSFVLWFPKIILGLVIALVATVLTIYVHLFTNQPEIVTYTLFAVVPLSLIFSGFLMLKYKNTWYVVTNRRVIKKTKILGRDSSSKPHHEIVRNDVNISTFAYIVSKLTSEDIGDIIIRTADDTGRTFHLRQVPEVHLAERYIDELSSDEDYLQHEKGIDKNEYTAQDNREPAETQGENRHPLPEDVNNATARQEQQDSHTQPNQQFTGKENTSQTKKDQTQPSHPNANMDNQGHQRPSNDIEEELNDFEPSDKA